MLVKGRAYRSLWLAADGRGVEIIDQTQLPFRFVVDTLRTVDDAVRAIRDMKVRGAPLIGATAAYGICLGLGEATATAHLLRCAETLLASRPTAVNLRWAIERMQRLLEPLPEQYRLEQAYREAARICEEDVQTNEAIGDHGRGLIETIWRGKGGGAPINILTHCNAGWLATVDWGTALAPVYKAAARNIPLHVWVDETRPRNQGAALTAWELQAAGIPCHLIVDNAGGHLMQQGLVDLCLVGADRTTAGGDVCNKIGTYLKALAAFDNRVPFYVALPGSTIDWTIDEGLATMPIEERGAEEVLQMQGVDASGAVTSVRIAPEGTKVANPAFDVTPARLVSGLITERGICEASRKGLTGLYPERR